MESVNFVVEKLREAFHLLGNLGGVALAWFNSVLPPQTRAEKVKQCLDVTKPYLAPAATLVVVVMLIRCIFGGGGGGSRKMMKAPGKNHRMPRADFESDPKGYFCSHRKHKDK